MENTELVVFCEHSICRVKMSVIDSAPKVRQNSSREWLRDTSDLQCPVKINSLGNFHIRILSLGAHFNFQQFFHLREPFLAQSSPKYKHLFSCSKKDLDLQHEHGNRPKHQMLLKNEFVKSHKINLARSFHCKPKLLSDGIHQPRCAIAESTNKFNKREPIFLQKYSKNKNSIQQNLPFL